MISSGIVYMCLLVRPWTRGALVLAVYIVCVGSWGFRAIGFLGMDCDSDATQL